MCAHSDPIGPTWAWAGPQSMRIHFENASFLKQIISYLLVARSEPKIHTNPPKIMPYTFPHTLGVVRGEQKAEHTLVIEIYH